jgi:hypothetical protein
VGSVERGSATRSGFDGSRVFKLSNDLYRGGTLGLTEPRSNRNAVASFSPVAADVSRLKYFRAGIETDSRPLLPAQR